MGSPESIRRSKRETEDHFDSRSPKDEAECESEDKRKHRSSKSRKSNNNGEEAEGVESGSRKRSSGERKRSGGSSKDGSDDDDYEARKESHLKQMKKKQEESALEKLSNWYQDGEGDNGDKSRGHVRGHESERRKSSSKKIAEGNDGRSHDEEGETKSDRRESSREKSHGSRRRWDESDSANDPNKHENTRERSLSAKTEPSESSKIRGLDSNSEREGKSKTWLEDTEQDSTRERTPIHVESHVEEDANTWMREKGKREIDHERSERRHQDSDYFEADNSGRRRKEPIEKDTGGYRDDRSKGREENWNERSRDRDWDTQRRGGRDRSDLEHSQGRSGGGRKDGIRTEAVKTSSNYGISNENYDVIEIQTKPFDYGREQSNTKSAPNDEEYVYPRRSFDDDSKDRFTDEGPSLPRGGQKGNIPNRAGGSQNSGSGSQPLHEAGPFNRGVPQGFRGSRVGRGGSRGGSSRPTNRDNHNQQVGMPVPMLGSPFVMPPPVAIQPLTPAMSPAPGPPNYPGIFIPPFSPPVWPGAVPPGLSPVPTGPNGPRLFPTNMGTPPSPVMYFNQQGPTRGPPNPNFNPIVPIGRGQPQEKSSGGWVPPPRNISGPLGKAPSRGEQNDYSQNFVDTGMRPQNFIRELELTSVVEDYPKLRELIQKKDEIVAKSASAPMYYKCDLREVVLSPEFFGTKFDVILVDPPWEEYVHRAPGVTDHMDYWTFEEIMNLKIEAIADTPSFIFLWVGDGVGLEQGRQCLKKWGFRRCEDICWVKTNKTNATPGLRHDSHTLFQRSKEHCLMGIKGTVRRSTDGHIIHANIDTDVIIAEEPPYGSTAKPEDMYRIVEHFSLGRRRLELFGEDHNIRSGWLTVGKDLSSSNFSAEAYIRNFADKDGKVWQGGGGRNPPPEAGHLVVTTPDIEALRPKSPMKNQQQIQQQSASIALTPGNSTNRRTANSPQNHNAPSGLNQDASSSNIAGAVPWGPGQPIDGFKGGNMGPEFDGYGFNVPFGQGSGDYMDFESHRAGMNLL